MIVELETCYNQICDSELGRKKKRQIQPD